MSGSKTRLDERLVADGLAPTRAKARGLVIAGQVRVNGARVDKAGAQVAADAEVTVLQGPRYVSRGGLKLEGALGAFEIDVAGLTCLDVGASTGGFTDCFLQRGAACVHAVDVGKSQMEGRLQADARVTVIDRTNARALPPDALPSTVDVAAIDVSFISLTLVLGPVAACVRPGGTVLAMVKPQFEVGRADVGKGGVVRDPEKIRTAVDKVRVAGEDAGLVVRGEAPAAIKGPKGNQEVFVCFDVPADGARGAVSTER